MNIEIPFWSKINVRFYILLLLATGVLIHWQSCGSSDSNKQEERYAQTGDPVIDALTNQIAENPEKADPWFQRAQAFHQQEAYDQAISDMNQAMNRDSTNLEYYHFLTDVFLDYFRSKKALQTITKASKIQPDHIPTLLKLAETYMIVEQFGAAEKVTKDILKLDPEHSETLFLRGLIFEEKEENQKAVDNYLSAAEIDPENTDAWINLGRMLDATRDARAAQYFQNAIQVDSSNLEAWLGLGNHYFNMEQYEKAVEIFDKMHFLNAQYPHSYFNKGLLYLETGEPEKAWLAFDMTLEVDVMYVKAYYYRGLASEQMGDLKAAKGDYMGALQFFPEYEEAKQGLARVQAQIQ